MSTTPPPDPSNAKPEALAASTLRADPAMNSFVASCVNTVAGSAVAVQRRTRHRPSATRLVKLLSAKRNILITTHQHPDPDALASAIALQHLLSIKLKDARVAMSIKGEIGGGMNSAFTRHATLNLTPWDDGLLSTYDAIILLDTQPTFAYSPLPAGVTPLAVIDHHRSSGPHPHCPFCDIRTDVGATSSIIFSYFLELQVTIPSALAAALLYAIETDLAGAAGQPGELDNIALSNLTLLADTHILYQMRYVDLPQSYYIDIAAGLASAMYYDNAIMAELGAIQSLERPAVIADMLLRFEPVQWSLVSGVHGSRLVLSLRTNLPDASAADLMKRLVKKLGEGGGHRTKAGGVIPLAGTSPDEVRRVRKILRRRYLRALGISVKKGLPLVPSLDAARPLP